MGDVNSEPLNGEINEILSQVGFLLFHELVFICQNLADKAQQTSRRSCPR